VTATAEAAKEAGAMARVAGATATEVGGMAAATEVAGMAAAAVEASKATALREAIS